MFNLTKKWRILTQVAIATTFFVIGGFPGHHMITGQLDLGQAAWGKDETNTTSDRDVLVELYHAMGGDSWTHNDGWLSEAPLDEWYGLRVSNGRVIYLELDDNNLVGEIPKEIGRLDRLHVLDLRWNSITGGLENLESLVKLGELRLSANDFSGSIPESFGKLVSLRRLDVSDNRFTGAIPSEIGNLRFLEAFAAHGNKLTGPIPLELGHLPSLKRLVLSENELTGSVSDILTNCATLQHVALANNQFEGTVPEDIVSSKRMNWLDLRGNRFDDDLQPVHRVNFPGIYIQPELIDKLNGLALWGKGSSLYTDEKFRLSVVRTLGAISVEDGFLVLAEARVPADFIEQASDTVQYVNSYLRESQSRIRTLSDLERMMAKAEKRSLTNTLKRLDAMHNVMQFESIEKVEIPDHGGDNSLLKQTITPAVFVVDTEELESLFGTALLRDRDTPFDFLKVSEEEEEVELSADRNPQIRFTVRLTTTSVYLNGETNLKADGKYEYVSGTTGGQEMDLYYAMHQVASGGGFSGEGTEVAHVEYLNHRAVRDKDLQVNWNLNSKAYFFARLTATPSYGRFSPPFVLVQSGAVWHER